MKSSGNKISSRLETIIEALPLFPGIRILEVGCGSGSAAREIASRIGPGYILAIDRSSKAIQQAIKSSQLEIDSGHLSFRQVAVENFQLDSGGDLYDIAFGIRVGALDGRHPELFHRAISRIIKALKPDGRLFIDGGYPLLEIPLDSYR